MTRLTLTPDQKVNDWIFVRDTTERRDNCVVGLWRCLGCGKEHSVVNTSVIQGRSKRCVDCGHKHRIKPRNLLSLDRKRKLKVMTAEDKVEYWKLRKIERVKSHESVRGKAGELYRQARRSCLKNNLKFDITREWIVEKILTGRCEATGVQFNLKRPVNSHFNWEAPSLDRKDAKGGYTKDNVQVTTWRYNNAKSFMNEQEFFDFCYLVANHSLTDSRIVRS